MTTIERLLDSLDGDAPVRQILVGAFGLPWFWMVTRRGVAWPRRCGPRLAGRGLRWCGLGG